MSPDFEILNYARFRPNVVATARIERLCTDLLWGEGPVYFADGDYLLFSDIPNNRIMKWVPGLGATVHRQPSNFANGNARDRQGRLITCESGSRRVTRTEYDGSVTVLADKFEGKRLNSPNDVVVRSNGEVWFTDPVYGIVSDYTGDKAESEIGRNYVFCLDPDTGALSVGTDEITLPNGLAFSPDERFLYVADSGATHDPAGAHHIVRFEVSGRRLRDGQVFATVSPGIADGFKVDSEGNVWTSAADGVHCYAADGELIGRIRFPETVTNLAFGGRKRSRLYVTTASGLYTVFVGTSSALPL
ncbi:SMP-30/gluconolactonase/LRE family protein [Pigmentiphaga soli]|uniref:SMP-30/gluconolactonase/LRE family protein n=1 Tax=Pigmentiphaga soli TaxID=1007095 RepID=A0ABP8HJA6_9BURK